MKVIIWLVQFLYMIYVFWIDMCIGGLFPYPGCILYGSMENKYDDDDEYINS
jgi:hypothetical protein